MTATPKQPVPAGDPESRLGQATTPGPPPAEVGDRAVEGRAPGATREGPCPTCGHYGPRIVVCYDPRCLHSLYDHKLKSDGTRGACQTTTAALGPCPCKKAVPTPETSS